MGRDKARLRLGDQTLLGWVQTTARQLSPLVRVIRRDLRPGCGPLGGVHTALSHAGAPTVLFLSCDMPFVRLNWLRRLLRSLARNGTAAFTERDGLVGFPFALAAGCLDSVERQMDSADHSLQALAARLQARRLRAGRDEDWQFRNLNTPAALQAAKALLGRIPKTAERTTARPAPQSSKTRTRRRPAR